MSLNIFGDFFDGKEYENIASLLQLIDNDTVDYLQTVIQFVKDRKIYLDKTMIKCFFLICVKSQKPDYYVHSKCRILGVEYANYIGTQKYLLMNVPEIIEMIDFRPDLYDSDSEITSILIMYYTQLNAQQYNIDEYISATIIEIAARIAGVFTKEKYHCRSIVVTAMRILYECIMALPQNTCIQIQ